MRCLEKTSFIMGEPHVQNSPLIFCAVLLVCLTCFTAVFDTDRITDIEMTENELRHIPSTRVLLSDLIKSLVSFPFMLIFSKILAVFP